MLGAEAPFENEPEVWITGFAAGDGAAGAAAAGKRSAGGAWSIRVAVKDGEKTAAVDASKVASRIEATGDLSDWSAASAVAVSVEPLEGEGNAMRFAVTPDDAAVGGAFLRIGE